MRRIIMTTVTSSLLALALPAAASAQHSARHSSARHTGSHHRRHHRAHTVVFTAGATRSTPGITAPAIPATPESAGPAATIASFENGVLKLTLADGSTVAGKVTEQTEIECPTAGGEEAVGDDNGDENSGSGGESHGAGSSSFQGESHGSFQGDDEHGAIGGQTEGQTEGQCGVASLVKGAKVAAAELAVGSGGSLWEKVELAQ